MDLPALLTTLEANQDEGVIVTVPVLTVGCMVRRQFRAILRSIEQNGAAVEWNEERGFLDSIFTFRMRGTGRQLLPGFQLLAALSATSSGEDL